MSSHAHTDRVQKTRFARIGIMRKGVVLVINTCHQCTTKVGVRFGQKICLCNGRKSNVFSTENITKSGTLCLETWRHVYNTSVVGKSAQRQEVKL